MKRMLLVLLALVFIYPMISIGAEKDSINLKLVWEKEIPQGVKDFVFLDENGYNVFSVQCKNPEKALKEKRLLMVQGNKLVWYEGDAMRVVKEMAIGKGTSNENKVVISKNGRNIAILNGTILRLLNWKGNELTRGTVSTWEDNYIYPLGNDKTIAISTIGGEGRFYEIAVYTKEGNTLKKVFGPAEGHYPTGHFDYAEDGSIIFFIYTDKSIPVDGKSNVGERIIIDNEGIEIARYTYQHPGWAGFVSPKGNYIAEVTRGKYLVIRDSKGHLISEHHVQGRGNYYGAFSPDEKYLCMTPGPWRVYFFETKTGKMLWEYVDTLSRYRSIAIDSQGDNIFLSSTLFHHTDLSLQESAKKYLIVFNHVGEMIGKEIVSLVKTPEELEFYRWKSITPPVRITSDGEYLMVRLPSKLQLYHIIRGGKDETN